MEKVSYRKGKHQYGCREALTSIGFAGLPPKKNTVTHIICMSDRISDVHFFTSDTSPMHL